ncbi:hypothetical protein ACQCN2_21560 [Brevibacillus ginsengisoli]|uniref:hypothetical protein n=1 Tax=Brevibacillus ginsengisoli TaxID=363854 RepID=UPI003CE96C53
MEPIWTLLVDSEEGSLSDDLQHTWNRRGFTITTEERAATATSAVHGLLVSRECSISQLLSRTMKWLSVNGQSKFLILLVGDEIPHGMAEQLHAASGAHPVDVVRLFLLPDQEHAVIGGDPSSDWVSTLRRALADEGVISQICQRIEADEAAVCLSLYLEWKHHFYMFIGERCDQLQARADVVAWALGMDKRIGQGWIQDKPSLDHVKSIPVHSISPQDWMVRELRLLLTQINPRAVAIWSDERSIALIAPEIERHASIRLYVTGNNHRANHPGQGRFLRFTNPQESLIDADALLILDVDPLIKEMSPHVFVQTMRKPVILDACSCYPLQEMEAFHIAYRTIGQRTRFF